MLPNFSQYSPQGLLPQFPQMIPGSFAHGSYGPFGYDPRQLGIGQYPFGTAHPYLQSHQGSAGHVTSQVVPHLVQLAQQIFVQNVVAQQIGTALYQLAQQLSVHASPIAGLDAGQALGAGAYPMIGTGNTLGFGTPFFGNPAFLGSPGGQPFVQHPFATANPQTPTWNANRPTIQ
jgi:hypothetical protein